MVRERENLFSWAMIDTFQGRATSARILQGTQLRYPNDLIYDCLKIIDFDIAYYIGANGSSAGALLPLSSL